jgi:hypothetical protein
VTALQEKRPRTSGSPRIPKYWLMSGAVNYRKSTFWKAIQAVTLRHICVTTVTVDKRYVLNKMRVRARARVCVCVCVRVIQYAKGMRRIVVSLTPPHSFTFSLKRHNFLKKVT